MSGEVRQLIQPCPHCEVPLGAGTSEVHWSPDGSRRAGDRMKVGDVVICPTCKGISIAEDAGLTLPNEGNMAGLRPGTAQELLEVLKAGKATLTPVKPLA